MKTDIQTKKKLNVDLEEVDQTQRESPQKNKGTTTSQLANNDNIAYKNVRV